MTYVVLKVPLNSNQPTIERESKVITESHHRPVLMSTLGRVCFNEAASFV